MNRTAFVLMLSALSGLSVPQGGNAQAVQPQPQCELQIYFYIDRSGSLKRADQMTLASDLARVLKSEYIKNYISNERHVYLIPFAGILGTVNRIEPPGDLQDNARDNSKMVEREIREAFVEDPKELGIDNEKKNKTDMFKVIEDIDRRLGNLDQASAGKMAFIILSDFEHDLSEGNTDFDRRNDRASWERSEVRVTLASLRKKFGADKRSEEQAGNEALSLPLLFLLPIKREENLLNTAKDVLDDLEHLTAYDAQITSAGSFSRNVESVLRLLRPLAIESRVVPENGRLFNEVQVRNRSCQSLPTLVLTREKVSAPGVKLDEKAPEFNLALGETKHFKFEIQSEPPRAGEPPSAPEVKVSVTLKDSGGATPSPLAEQYINFHPFVFLKKFVGIPTPTNHGFVDVRAHLIRGYSGSDMKVRFRLTRDGITYAGESDELTIKADPDTAPKLIEEEVTLKISGNMLPAYCCDEKWKTDRLSLEVLTEPVQARVQTERLPVNIVTNGDATRDLLEGLAQQASLPALATLLTLFCVTLASRSLNLGHVEELTAVAGLCFATIFLLAHHIPLLGHAMDIVLMGKPADVVGAVICALLAAVVVAFGWRGTVFPSGSESKINLHIERDVRSARDRSGVVERRVGWSWMRYPTLAALAGMILGLGGFLLVNRTMPDCVLNVSDELLSYTTQANGATSSAASSVP